MAAQQKGAVCRFWRRGRAPPRSTVPTRRMRSLCRYRMLHTYIRTVKAGSWVTVRRVSRKPGAECECRLHVRAEALSAEVGARCRGEAQRVVCGCWVLGYARCLPGAQTTCSIVQRWIVSVLASLESEARARCVCPRCFSPSRSRAWLRGTNRAEMTAIVVSHSATRPATAMPA